VRYAPAWPVLVSRGGRPGLASGPGRRLRRPVTHEGIRANTPGEGNRPGGG